MNLFTEKNKNIARWSMIIHVLIAFITMPTYQLFTHTNDIPTWGNYWMVIILIHFILYFAYRMKYKWNEIENKHDDDTHPHSF